MLTRKRPETIAVNLTLKGQGVEESFNITYYNRKQSEVDEKLKVTKSVPDTILYIVKEWESDIPLTAEALREVEDEQPGLLMSIIQGFHEARGVKLQKN